MSTTHGLLITILIFVSIWSIFITASLKNIYDIIEKMQRSFRDNNKEAEIHFDCLKWRLTEVHNKVINGLDPVTLEDEEDEEDEEEDEKHQWFRVE